MRFYSIVLFLSTAESFRYGWERLHTCTSSMELKKTVVDYKENFPCLDCREHFQSLLKIHPFPLDYVQTSEDVRVWTWFTHNLVNQRLNKTWESFDIMDQCHDVANSISEELPPPALTLK